MLTRKQHTLLVFIDHHLRDTGFSPSFEEMKTALGLRSKSGIHRLIASLVERGFLARRPRRARALEVLRMPETGRVEPLVLASSALASSALAPAVFAPNVIRGDFSPKIPAVRTAGNAAAVQLPLYGRIAAGLPIEAIAENAATLDVPTALLGGGEHYALEVAGDSMVDAGILDGDTVLIRRGDTAETGQIVVALVKGEEVTLKRLRRHRNSIALEPANAAYQTQLYPADQVRIQGTLIGLMRRYD